MLQSVAVDNVDGVKDDTESTTELAVALLTNPAGTDKLGLNVELYYAMNSVESAGSPAVDSSEVGGAVELLYVF